MFHFQKAAFGLLFWSRDTEQLCLRRGARILPAMKIFTFPYRTVSFEIAALWFIGGFYFLRKGGSRI